MKSPARLARQMLARGWTSRQIEEDVDGGLSVPTVNSETGAPATRYIHQTTGRSVVIDDVTGDVIHVGGDGFIY